MDFCKGLAQVMAGGPQTGAGMGRSSFPPPGQTKPVPGVNTAMAGPLQQQDFGTPDVRALDTSGQYSRDFPGMALDESPDVRALDTSGQYARGFEGSPLPDEQFGLGVGQASGEFLDDSGAPMLGTGPVGTPMQKFGPGQGPAMDDMQVPDMNLPEEDLVRRSRGRQDLALAMMGSLPYQGRQRWHAIDISQPDRTMNMVWPPQTGFGTDYRR